MPCNGISFAEQGMTEAELGSVRAAARMNVPNGTTAAGQHSLSLGKSIPIYNYFMLKISQEYIHSVSLTSACSTCQREKV